MRQIVAFVLAFTLFVSALVPPMSAEQTVRLPELLVHYHQHQLEEGQNLSFWAFLIEHYATDSQHHKAPNHSHNRLPSFDGGVTGFVFAQPFQLNYTPSVTEQASLAVFRVPLLHARQVFFSLLQPPKY